MLFEWSKEKIELYERASKETGFHKKLAEIVIPFLNAEDEMTDIGCGPGLIDFELSPYVKTINAIDINEIIIDYLTSKINNSSPCNISASIGDAEKMDGNIGDVALFCYYTSLNEHMYRIIDSARRLAIIIMHGKDAANKPSKIGIVRKTYTSEMEENLVKHGYNYIKKNVRVDFSQPIKTKEEALYFLEMYCSEKDSEKRKNIIDEGLKTLRKSDSSDYPYSLYKIKDVTVFIIKK